MTRPRIVTLVIAVLWALAAGPQAAVQEVLVLCTANQCDYRLVTNVVLSGNSSIRSAQPPLDSVSPRDVGQLPETGLDRISGLYRDAKAGIWYEISQDASRGSLAVPLKISGKAPVALGSLWQGTAIDYVPSGAKSKTTVQADSLAYLLVSANADEAVSALFRHLLHGDDSDPRRLSLIRGALKFNAKAQTVQTWRSDLLGQIRSQVQRFDRQEGDPVTLPDALHAAVQLKEVYSEGGVDTVNRELLEHVTAASQLFAERQAIADALRTAGLWDDYLVKIRQLGLARWSLPDALAHERDALIASTQLHLDRSMAFTKNGHPDRAFDEAAIAARNSCDRLVLDSFNQARIQLVDHDKIGSAIEPNGSQRALLEQIVRSLDPLDPSKEQVTLDQIQQGEAIDPNYLPLQWKKAEFLDKLGRYTDALAVLQRIERSVRLDRAEAEICLALDGTIRINLLDAIGKSIEGTRKAFEDGQYQDALTAAARGLRADHVNTTLLYYSALSAAFLRQTEEATRFVRTYLQSANMACTSAGEPEKILELNRAITAQTVRADPANGIPNWVSGVSYRTEEAFYDPISLAFTQPVRSILALQLLGYMQITNFQRENRSFLVSSIVTVQDSARTLFEGVPKNDIAAATRAASQTIFEATPKYDRQTLAMLEIGPPSTVAGEPPLRLTYLNSPNIDPGLVLKFTGKKIARGWAGNPFFHPFIWNGFYAFDLTYDDFGRVVSATPISQVAGSRPDLYSEPLEFTWDNGTNRLRSIHGLRSGYLRELSYGGCPGAC